VLLTGLSGSGKSQAIRALEDLGYFCVDNLPTPLIPTVAELSLRVGSEIDKAAIVVDVREGGLLAAFPKVLRELRAMPGLSPVVVFLEASDVVLVRRFSETRRPHPLAKGRSVRDGIEDERVRLASIRQLADEVIDTSAMTVHELRDAFMRLFREVSVRAPRLVVTLMSFGFKHGLPPDADLVFDVRFLPNPHFVGSLRRRTGRAPSVVAYLRKFPATEELLTRTTDFLNFLLPQYVGEGKSYLTIAVGCTGGRHRSVAIAEALRGRISRVPGVKLRLYHRDIRMP
jgi:UPF0042 nucleotide-binding protein